MVGRFQTTNALTLLTTAPWSLIWYAQNATLIIQSLPMENAHISQESSTANRNSISPVHHVSQDML
jgi:hypothetical protein